MKYKFLLYEHKRGRNEKDMEQIFTKKVCQKCNESFYTSKTGYEEEYCPACKASDLEEGLLDSGLDKEIKEKEEWINLKTILNDTDKE